MKGLGESRGRLQKFPLPERSRRGIKGQKTNGINLTPNKRWCGRSEPGFGLILDLLSGTRGGCKLHAHLGEIDALQDLGSSLVVGQDSDVVVLLFHDLGRKLDN